MINKRAVNGMRLNTHDRTPKPKMSKLIKVLLAVCATLIYGIFALLSFACFCYGQSIVGGLLVIGLAVTLTLLVLIPIWDMNKAYVDINGENIWVVDYYLGIPRTKTYAFSDIASAEIALGYSHRVKGYRMGVAGIRYIVFKNKKRYLFKIIYLPETEEIFKQYLQ